MMLLPHQRASRSTAMRTTFATAVVLVLVALATGCQQTTPTTPTDTTGSAPATLPPVGSGTAEAGLTVGTTEGPYYITSTPELTDGNLNYADLPGEPIKITGHVYGGTGTSAPIANATVEIWHADAGGDYHPNSNGDANQYSASDLALRGYVLTDENGAYEYTSIYPGYYQGRTRHIHSRASADGFGGVVTQIIVPAKSGDGTTPETDNIAQSLPDANFVTFTDENGVGVASFDFHLGAD